MPTEDTTEVASYSFHELVVEPAVEFPEVAYHDWKRRTRYGKMRILPFLLLSPLLLAALTISGGVVAGCFFVAEKASIATERVWEIKDSWEPNIYKEQR